MFTCSAMLQTADDFHAQFDELLLYFLQFCLLLAVLISSSVTLSLPSEKRFTHL